MTRRWSAVAGLVAMVLAMLSIATLGAVRSADATTVTYDHEGEDLIQITHPDGWMIDTEYVADAGEITDPAGLA